MMAWHGGAALLVLASFLPVYLLRRRGEPWCMQVSLGIAILALHALSFANVIAGPLPGAHWDAETFHDAAAKMAALGTWPEVSMGTKFYELILTATYRVLGAHLLVGQSLSVVAAAFTLMLFNRIAVTVGVQDARIRSAFILVSGLFPTFLYHGGLTFREPFELLGLVVGAYFVLKTFQEFSWVRVGGAIGGFVFMGLFHHVLLGICVLLICLFVLLLYTPKLGNVRGVASLAGLLLLISATGYVAITNIPITLENNYVKEIRKEHGIIRAIARYRATIDRAEPRTSFGSSVEADSLAEFAGSAAANYWHYLSRPFVSDLRRAGDVAPFSGTVARLVLLAGFLWLALGRRAFNRNLAFCLGTYLVVTGVWSLGTTNYGQAFRHHALTDWLAVFMFGYAMYLVLARGRAAHGRLERVQ
jgi:hypothetical protein